MAAGSVFAVTPTENLKQLVDPDIHRSVEKRKDRSQLKMDGLFECKGCSENYSDDRIPRLLSCGHTLCTACIEKFTEAKSTCPECNQKEPVKSVDKYAINYSLLRLVRSFPTRYFYIGHDSIALLTKVFDSSEYRDGYCCEVHKNPICLFCYRCASWVCQDCLVIDHPIPPRGSCKVVEFGDTLRGIKRKFEEVVDETSMDVESMKKNFKFDVSIHDFCQKHCTKERSHLRITRRVEDLIEGESESNESVVHDTRKRLKKFTDSDVTTSQDKLTLAIQDLMSFKKELKNIISEERKRLSKAMPPMRKHLRLDLKQLALSTKPVYTIINEGEKTMFARIMVKDQRLLVYSLQMGEPSEDCVTVPYGFIKKLIPNHWSTVFFEIGTTEESFGRVYTLMDVSMDYNQQAKQMLLMCTGEQGVSYKDTNFYKYEESGFLHGGDYEKNDGTGGKAIIEGLGHTCISYVYEEDSKFGTLVCNRVSTRFSFYLKYQLKECLEGKVGKVYDGLDILKAVSKLEPVTKAVIRDCGVVIPMNPKYSDEIDCMDPEDD